MTAVIENHVHRDFVQEAAEKGWQVSDGPWGYSEGHERTLTLQKTLPNNDKILVWMLHRNMGVMGWSKEECRWVTTYPENGWMTGVQAWHQSANGGQHGLKPNLEDVLEKGISEEYWLSLASTCDNCGKAVENLHHVAFANKACDDCVSGLSEELEFPGWYN